MQINSAFYEVSKPDGQVIAVDEDGERCIRFKPSTRTFNLEFGSKDHADPVEAILRIYRNPDKEKRLISLLSQFGPTQRYREFKSDGVITIPVSELLRDVELLHDFNEALNGGSDNVDINTINEFLKHLFSQGRSVTLELEFQPKTKTYHPRIRLRYLLAFCIFQILNDSNRRYLTCSVCTEMFIPSKFANQKSQYCSQKCKQVAYRQKKKLTSG